MNVSATPVALRSSTIVMLCRSFTDPEVLITDPVAGSNSTGEVKVYLNGTPIAAVVCPAGFCLSIFSTGISRFWQFG